MFGNIAVDSLPKCNVQLNRTGKTSPHAFRRGSVRLQAQSSDLGDNVKRMAKQVQASLPVVGLLSRLFAPEGGVGNEMQAYPEYCRAVYEAAPEGFQIAVAELQNRYGQSCQRKYVLLVLWMARLGAGVVSGKSIADGARKLRYSYDIEFEMERFDQNVQEVYQKYTYVERPQGTLQQQADMAVDVIARLCLNLPDGEEFKEEDAQLVANAAFGAIWDKEGAREAIQRSLQTRAQRKDAYTL